MSAEYVAVRRAYELGRLRSATRRAAIVIAIVAPVTLLTSGVSGLVWLPVTMAAWLFAYWRGGPVLAGAYRGLVGGAITLLLPMSILRPCCSPAAIASGMPCCTMPGACLGAGAALGLLLALAVPRGRSWPFAAGGMCLGVASIALLRCGTLFAGEAVGLVGGLLAGVIVTSSFRALTDRRVSA